jgi:DNA-directed RNA polymerase subunit RPC12/RpoP
MNHPEFFRRLDYDDEQFERTVAAGIAAVKGNDKQQARNLLFKAAGMKPSDPRPWLWLSAVSQDTAEQIDFLEHAVSADPGNAAARRGLALLTGKLDPQQVVPEGEEVAPRNPQAPEPAQAVETYLCAQCGGHMAFDAARQALTCEFCGATRRIESSITAEAAEQPLDFTLFTTRGHRWAEAEHTLSCERCGASWLLPVAQTAGECPYCGSRQVIASVESQELVAPQVIAPAALERGKVERIIRDWLGQGWFIPDDLRKLARSSALRPAYYPFWTFDGTLELRWSAQVNEGSQRMPVWRTRSGAELEMFDDELVSGFKSLDEKALAGALPFRLKDLVEFKTDYLAGWTALTYDRALSDATLLAREHVARRLRRSLNSRVLVGIEHQNLQSGATNWIAMTYKLALLPLWVGSFHYKDREYHLIVNGQTGKVGGVKPTDRVKVVSFIASVLLTLGVVGLLLWLLAYSQGWVTI